MLLKDMHLVWYMFAWQSCNACHEVSSDEGSDDSRVLTGGLVAAHFPVKVDRNKHHWHLADFACVTCGQHKNPNTHIYVVWGSSGVPGSLHVNIHQ